MRLDGGTSIVSPAFVIVVTKERKVRVVLLKYFGDLTQLLCGWGIPQELLE